MQEQPTRTSGAAWMVRLGAFLILCVPPLEVVTERLYEARAVSVETITISSGRYSTGAKTVWTGGIVLVSAMTFLLGSSPKRAPCHARAVISAAIVFSSICTMAAHRITASGWTRGEPLVPPWMAAGLPGLGSVVLSLLWGWGIPSGRLIQPSRLLMTLVLTWIVVLEWSNRRWRLGELGMLAAIAGALLVALGELLRPRYCSGGSTLPPSGSGGINPQKKW